MTTPSKPSEHTEHHYLDRAGWLRAGVLGANDGLVSTASLLMGLAASSAGDPQTLLVAGMAAVVAGALSMAAGEYVSVSSQVDVERVDTAIEAAAIAQDPEAELEELTAIYIHRGVEPELARQVAHQLMEKDALHAHLREELGLTDVTEAKPLQAALSSALAFGIGAGLPLLCALVVPTETAIALSSVGGLFLLGLVSSWAGGGVRFRSVMRVVLWGSAAMALTWLVGSTV